MTARLVLVEGDLALPMPFKTGRLPPPFGRSWQANGGVSESAPLARPAQPPESPRPAHASRRAAAPPPGLKHILFYKAPAQRRVDTRSIDAALEEAKRYLALSPDRPRSTRSDYILGATIVAGCSIALTWLLVTCSMRDDDNVKEVATKPLISSGSTVSVSHSISRDRPVVQAYEHSAAAQRPRSTVANSQRVSQVHAAQRVATSQTMRAKTRLSASLRSEWSAKPSRINDAAEQAALMSWAVQQRRLAQAIRVGALPDENWRTRMSQQRITDNPDAFQGGHAHK